MTVKANKTRKRPAPPNLDEENDEVAAKIQKENISCVISEVEFKFLLSDQATALEGLEKFIQLAENVASGLATADIVSAYCRSSQTCSELFDLIEPGRQQLKTNEMALVFRCLELILTRIRTDLVKFASTGEAIVQRILASHMGQVYNGLQEQNKSKTMKASLQLLTAMVSLSERAKRAVQSRLNFGHVCFPALFRRRNRKDPTDVRSCAVLLTLAFLVDSDLNTISSLVQQKSFIQQTVAGLKYDRRELVLEVLATLLDKVVTLPGLSKTDKVKLFSEAVLKQLCELYDWQGPTGWLPTSKKKKKENQVRVTPEGFSEDQETVANVCHEFLVEVCCSHKNGVNFHDKTVGTGQRNHNQLLDHLVAWLAKKMDEQRRAVLVTEILCACPDLIKATLTNMGPSLSPRWSEKWRQLLTWLINLYRRLPDVPPFLGGQDYLKSAQGSVISMATVFCLPPPSVAAVIAQGLKHEDIRVRDKCARLVQVSAKKASAIRGQLAAGTTAGGAGVSAFGDNLVEAFSARVMKTLPPTGQIFVCVDKTMQLMSTKQVDGLEAAVVDEKEPAVDLSGHASVLLQILGLYQTLIPSLLSERPKDLAKLIDMVGCLQSHHHREPPAEAEAVGNREGLSVATPGGTVGGENVQRWMPQLYLLKLLSDTDAAKISLGREGLMEKLLLSASESHKFRNLTIGLVCKMLQGMEIFSEHAQELHTWLDIALSSASELQKAKKTSSVPSPSLFNPVTFLARCVATLINNPSPYVDRVMEAVGEVSRASGIADESDELTSSGPSRSAIDAILLMDDQELDSRLDKCLPHVATSQHSSPIHLPLSPLAVVALESLHYGKTGDSGKEYVSAVLGHLLHSLPDPVILASIVTKSETKLSNGVREYIQYWAGGQANRSVTRPLPAASFGVFTSAIMRKHFNVKSSHCTVEELSNLMKGMTSREMLIGLKQALLYVEDILKAPKQTAECEKKVKMYLDLATSLSDDILAEKSSKAHSDGLSDFRGFLAVSKDVSKDVADSDVLDQEQVSAAELDVFDVLFSRVISSASDNVVTDALKCVLLNPTLKAFLFKTTTEAPHLPDKKSPKRKEKVLTADLISKHVSQFVCSTIARFSDSLSSFEAEIGIVEEYVSLILNEILGRRLPPQLEEFGSEALKFVAPQLDMASLSQCVVKLLQLPASALIITTHYEDGELVWATWPGSILYNLLQNLTLLIEADPLFINTTQIAKLIRPSDLELCAGTRASLKDVESGAINERIQIRAAFNFEENTRQKVSEFAKVFELLPCHKDCSLTEFAVFALNSLPQLAAVFRPDLFTELFKDPLTSLDNSDKTRLFTSIVKNVKGSFLLYEQWLAGHVPTVVKQNKWSLIHTYLEANVHFSGGYSKTVEAVKQTVNSVLNKLDPTSFFLSLPSLTLLSLAVQNNDPAFQQRLADTIVGCIRRHKKCRLQQFLVSEACAEFSSGSSGARQAGQSSHSLFLDRALGYMVMNEETYESISLKEYLEEWVGKTAARLADRDWKLFAPSWRDLTQLTVRHKLTDAKRLKLVADLAEKVVSTSPDPTAAQRLFEQCVDHTLFLQVMTSPEFMDAKVELVKLVYTLGGLHPSGYKRAGLRDVLVAAYTASLSLTDQRLLLMMESCSRSLGTQFECPSLWGKSALDHQEVTEVLGASLHRQAPSQATLEQLNPELMKDSILHFPVRRLHSGNAIVDASEFKSRPECYDPAFLLKLFVQILSPDKQVPLRAFVEKDCLSYLLISLSSHDLHSRLLAYHALNDFYLHTDGARWHDKLEMTFILDLLNASRVKDGQKLPFVVALFLARTVKLLLYPADLMYVPIFRFLVARPMMDLGNVPEFYKLFFSAGVHYKQERNWMLSLLCDGMRETSDYWLYQKKFIFKILLSFYDSAISDDHSQELILLMVKNACQEKSVAVDLVKNHGLLPWLAAAVTALEQRPEQTDLLCDIIHTLWLSLTEIRYLTHTQPAGRKSRTTSGSVISETESMDDEDNELGNTAENRSINRSSLAAADREVHTHSDSGEENDDTSNETHKKDSRSSAGRPTKVSRPTVPRSTAVEMALITKSLIWHLSNSSIDGLMNVLQVLHGMASNQTHSPSKDTPTPHTETEPAQDLLNLSPLESCLLLYHVSKAAQQTAIAAEAASVLKSRGMDVERKPKKPRKSLSRKEHSTESSSAADVPLVDNVAELEGGRVKDNRKSVRLPDESESNCLVIRKDAQRYSLGSEDDMKRLFKLFHEIVTFSGTLEFV